MGNFPESKLITKPCPVCKGFGKGHYEGGGLLFSSSEKEVPCPNCKGSGKISFTPTCHYNATAWNGRDVCIGDTCMLWDEKREVYLDREALLKQLEIKNV